MPRYVQLLIADPRSDFYDPERGAPGADADMRRLAGLIRRLGNRIDTIHVTLDSPPGARRAPDLLAGRVGEESVRTRHSAIESHNTPWRRSECKAMITPLPQHYRPADQFPSGRSVGILMAASSASTSGIVLSEVVM